MYNVHLSIMLESDCQAVYRERKRKILYQDILRTERFQRFVGAVCSRDALVCVNNAGSELSVERDNMCKAKRG